MGYLVGKRGLAVVFGIPPKKFPKDASLCLEGVITAHSLDAGVEVIVIDSLTRHPEEGNVLFLYTGTLCSEANIIACLTALGKAEKIVIFKVPSRKGTTGVGSSASRLTFSVYRTILF